MSPRRPSRPRPLVLIAEDNEDLRIIHARTLEEVGFRTEVALSGAEAVKKAHAGKPAAIVLDLGLPGGDGFFVLAQLRSAPETKKIPVLVVSGHCMQGEEEKARQAGARSFLMKPVDPLALQAELKRVLDRSAE